MTKFIFAAFIGFLFAGTIRAQECNDFIERQYGFHVEMDVPYGSALNYNNTNVNLAMNIFKPVGDGNTQRPLLVLIHGGGFTAGNRNQMNQLCEWYAERGYVAATISYRLGLHHVINPVFAVDFHEMVRALYRGMQDTRGAIRFLKERAELDSTDVNRVAVVGGSAGGCIAIHTAYMDQPEEKPASANALGSVLFTPRPDLGPIEGTMNLNGFDTDVRAVVNIFGGMRDTSLITSPDDPAIFAYHQTEDIVLHCGKKKPYWFIANDANNPVLDGSCVIQDKTELLGFAPENAVFHIHEGDQHDVHDLVLVDEEIAEFLNYQMCEIVTDVTELPAAAPVRIFPNPAKGYLVVESGEVINALRIFSITGKVVYSDFVQTDRVRVDLAGISDGLYLLQWEQDGNIYNEKIIIQ